VSHRNSASGVALEAHQLTLRYPDSEAVALTVEHLCIHRGQRVALIGPNGAGKSTLLKALVGLLPVAQGSLTIFGRHPAARPQAVAYVPQRREVDWQFPINALDVALMGRDVHLRWPRWICRQDRAKALAALRQVGMAEHAQRHIAVLSGGQQQRIFLARALAQESPLLLLDEPFVGVDTTTERVIFHVMEQLAHTGVTVIVATHDLLTVEAHFDQVVLLHQHLIADGSPQQVLQPHLLAQAYGGPLALFQERMPHELF